MVGAKHSFRQKQGITFHIAGYDLVREPLLTLCLILSVIAILTPILLLFSVKVGFIDRIRQDFINDPTFREIRPKSADLRQHEFFSEISNWPGVGYVIPTVMMNPREVAVRVKSDEEIYRDELRLLPSTLDDPLFKRIIGEYPNGDGVVVTSDFSESANLEVGDGFTIVVTRIENDNRKRVQFDVSVSGIIPADVLPTPTILGTPELERQVENFRAGISVPERGWPGVQITPKKSFSYLVVASPNALGEMLKSTIAIRIGTAEIKTIDDTELMRIVGTTQKLESIKEIDQYLLFAKQSSTYTNRDIIEANSALRNSEAYAFGIAQPLVTKLFGHNIQIFGLPDDLKISTSHETENNVRSEGSDFSQNNRILLPLILREHYKLAGEPERINVEIEFESDSQTKTLVVSLRPSGFIDSDSAVVNSELMGILNRGQHVNLHYDSKSDHVFEQSTGFRGFRVVGDDIDGVPELVERFEEAGVKVRAKSSEILKLQRLERSLNILVLVVSFVAIVGGISILTSSFFANVKRKQVAYATMRLIGMNKSLIALVPIAQAVMISGIGLLASFCCYFIISSILNQFIAAELNFDGQLSKLHWHHFLITGLIVIVGACIASIVASRAATNIDPAQALRAD